MSTTISSSGQTNMLVDQDDANVFSLGKALKGRFDGCGLCLAVDDKEVFLRIGAGGDVL